jgi:hypothetical protein
LVSRIARAAWRLERAERLEVELFAFRGWENANLGLTLVRDGNGTRSVDTIMRYRTSALGELMRCLRTLQALQAAAGAAADTRSKARPATPARPEARPAAATARPAVLRKTPPPAPPGRQNEPEPRPQPPAPRAPEKPQRGPHDLPLPWRQNEPKPERDRAPEGARPADLATAPHR